MEEERRVRSQSKGELLAEKVLNEHWNGDLPVDIHKLCQALRMSVVRSQALPTGAVAQVKRDISGRPCLTVSSAEPRVRERYALAHALGAALLGQPEATYYVGDYSVDAPSVEANAFSKALLMPEVAMDLVIMQGRTIEKIAQLLDVSEVAVSTRLKHLRVI